MEIEAQSDRERVIELIQNEVGREGVEIKDETRLEEDLGVDSIVILDVVLALEVEFGIEIADSEVESALTVGEVVALVRSKVAAAGESDDDSIPFP